MDKRLEIKFDENLWDIPCDPNGLKEYTNELRQKLKSSITPIERVRTLGELGTYLRSLNDLVSAQNYLLEALELTKNNHLGIKLEVQQNIRLAHVLQWQKRYNESDFLFNKIISACRINSEANLYLDFALQHAGKNLFDQSRFSEALLCFEEAMKLRIQRNAPEDQIASTNFAINRTKTLIK